MPRQTSQSCGLSGTFLDIIVVLVVGHKLNVPFRTLARAINGEATSMRLTLLAHNKKPSSYRRTRAVFVYAQAYRGTTTIRPRDGGLNRFYSRE